jgi:aldehyde dehydrogenase (NAD(P)+)
MGEVVNRRKDCQHQPCVCELDIRLAFKNPNTANFLIAYRTAEEITSVYAASEKDVDTAVKAARAALNNPTWRDLPGVERGKLMNRLAQLIEDNREILATIETCDNGKPYTVSRDDDLTETAETIRYYSGYADKIFGQVIGTTPDKFAYTVREPVGVCGQIIP